MLGGPTQKTFKSQSSLISLSIPGVGAQQQIVRNATMKHLPVKKQLSFNLQKSEESGGGSGSKNNNKRKRKKSIQVQQPNNPLTKS